MCKFSVVIPVYKFDNPGFLFHSLSSLFNQSRVPDEIVIVVDGPIGDNLNNIIENFINKKQFKLIRLLNNEGPGPARHNGILKCKNNIIALMDSDDICRNDRFEKELDILISKDIDAVGCWIEEFDNEPGDLKRLRITPEENDDIVSYSKWRMPVNNVTLVFKKEAYLSVGGYKSMRQFEDYDLVIRMLILNKKFYNIQEVLVDVRVGNEMHKRRKGFGVLKNELSVFKTMYSSGYIGLVHYTCNIIIRYCVRLLPSGAIAYLYNKAFR